MSDWEDITNSEWEEIPTPEADPGFIDYVSAPFQKAASSLGDAYAGLALMGADFKESNPFLSQVVRSNFPALSLFLDQDREAAEGKQQSSRRLSSEVDANLGLDPQGFPKQALDVVGQTIPAALSFLGGPLGAATYLGASSTGQKYGALDDMPDLSFGEKALDAGLTGATNAALSYVPLSFLGKSVGSLPSRIAKETAKVGAANVALSPAQVISNSVIDRAVAGIPTSPEQLTDRLGTAAVDSLITAPIFGAMGALAGRPGARPQLTQSKVHPVEGMIDALSEGPAPAIPDAPVMPEPMADTSPLVSEAVPQDPNFFTTNPEQLPVPVEPAGLPAGFPMNIPGPRSNWQPPAPEGFNRGTDFLYKDLAQPPMVMPDSQAQPPAVIPDPVIDPAQYQGPQEGFALDAQPQDVRDLTTPPIVPEQGYDARSPYVEKKRAQDVQQVQADLELTRRRIAEQERVNRSNEPQRQAQPSKVIEGTTQAESFDSPMARIQKAAEEAKTQEQPLIATPDNSPFTVRDAIKNVIEYIAKPKPSERGAIRNPFSKESKEIRDATTGDKRYTKYESRHLLAARNWYMTDSIAKDVPEVKPLADAILDMPEDNSRVLMSVEPDLMALYKMQGDDTVNSVIWKAEEKGSSFRLTPENIAKLGLTEDQVRAIQASKTLQLKASDELRRHSFDMVNREYNYKVKKATIEAPLLARDIEAKYQAEVEALRVGAFDQTDPRVIAETARLKQERDAALAESQTWLSDTINRAATERYNALKAIDQRHAAWDDSNYIPRNRYGKYKMKVFDKDGQLYEDRQTDSRSELAQWKKAYEANGFTTSIELLKQRAPTEHFNGISDEVTTSIDPVGGFKKHMMKSRRIPGADMDPVRAWVEYYRGLSKKIALDKLEMRWKEAMLELPRDPRDARQIDVNLSQAVNELQQRKDSILDTKSQQWRFISKITDLANLTFQLRTPISNLFAIPQRQYPELTKYGAQPEMTISKSFGLNLKRMVLTDEKFAKQYPELARGIAIAEANRTITPTPKNAGTWGRIRAPFEKQVSRIADKKNKVLSTADDVAFFLQFHSDRFAEANGFITGWEAYPQAVKHFRKNNLEVPTRQQFAEQFAKDTKANVKSELLPGWMQGAAQSTTLKYKTWQFRYLGALLDAAGKGNRAYVARAIGATLASAGVRGLPFYKTAVAAMTALGVSPEDKLQEFLTENLPGDTAETVASTIMYGPLSTATGTNFSGSTGFGDPLPDTSRGVEAAIGSLIGGPAASLIRKTIDFPTYLARGQTDRAIENLPLTVGLVTDLAKAYRMGKEGVVSKNGIGIVPRDEVTPAMIVRQLLGYGDMKTARAYDKYLAGQRAGGEGQDGVSYPALIAEAIVRGDTQREIALRQEADQAGKLLKERDIQEKVQKRLGDERAILKKYPKATREEAAKARGRY